MTQVSSLAAPGVPSRRDEIVEIARGIFAERGYTNTSMRDIAEGAGLMAGSLYSHFRSKAEILRLVVTGLVDRLEPAQEAVLATGGSGLDRFERMVRDVLCILADHPDETVIMHYDWSDLSQTAELADLARRSNRLLELWRSVVEAGQRDGSIRTDVRPEVVVRAVTSALHASVDTKRYGALPLQPPGGGTAALGTELTLLFGAGLAPSRPSGRTGGGPAGGGRQPATPSRPRGRR